MKPNWNETEMKKSSMKSRNVVNSGQRIDLKYRQQLTSIFATSSKLKWGREFESLAEYKIQQTRSALS